MGNNLLQIFISTIKSRFASIVSKLRLWTSWNFVRTRIIGGIRDFFFKLLDVKPKNKNDYYTIFGWLVSKKLAYAIVIIVGVVSIWFLTTTSKVYSKFVSNDGMRTYSYNSVMLRIAKNNVRIKAKDGHIAYVGEVSKGYATGTGKLYSSDNVMIYDGGFQKNKYEGSGNRYYDDGTLQYAGDFHENLYEGSGKLYRQDGTTEYDGEFSRGMKNGTGVLFDSGSNQLYQGLFSEDQIVYSAMLAKSPEEVRSMYNGSQVLYEESDDMGGDLVIRLNDIGAVYLASSDDAAADSSPKVSTVYVLSDKISSGGYEAKDITGLRQIFGDVIYEGNSHVEPVEAVVINILNDGKYVLNGKVDMDMTQNFSDAYVISDMDPSYSVYVYSFQRGNLIYSFFCKGTDGKFEFYGITDAGESGEDDLAA